MPDRERIGQCEGCGKAIYTDTPYFAWSGEDSVITCGACSPPGEMLTALDKAAADAANPDAEVDHA